ncbi:MAG: biopolymer transporter ExbD [Candidatus Nealsonbacteria bacterium]|nr:biopolymer transporter ExbD [Candidatus Nealsonbacteria bacterium]
MTVKIDKGSALENLSLTPLIDIVFLLLIFFLVATKFAEEEKQLDMPLPEASEAKPLTSAPGEIFVNVLHVGAKEAPGIPDDQRLRYFVSGEMLNLRQLEHRMRQAKADNPNREAVIRAHKRCAIEYVVAAVNACLKAKIRNYRITTSQPKG